MNTNENAALVAVPPQAPGSVLFPRTPERDKDGNANLYPGFPTYTGTAAIFIDDKLGEVVILAPSLDALRARLRRWMPEHELDVSKCKTATLTRAPNTQASDAKRSD
jgi:hypothetical protein